MECLDDGDVRHRLSDWKVATRSPGLILGLGGFLTLLSIAGGGVQLHSRVRLFAIPWTAARRASLSITSSWSLFKLMSIELVMPSNHLILCRPLLLLPEIFPSMRDFSNESGGQNVGAAASVLPMNIQGISDFTKHRITWERC